MVKKLKKRRSKLPSSVKKEHTAIYARFTDKKTVARLYALASKHLVPMTFVLESAVAHAFKDPYFIVPPKPIHYTRYDSPEAERRRIKRYAKMAKAHAA